MLKKVGHLLRRKESTDGSQPRLYAQEEEPRARSQAQASLASCLFPDGSNREVTVDQTFGGFFGQGHGPGRGLQGCVLLGFSRGRPLRGCGRPGAGAGPGLLAGPAQTRTLDGNAGL